MKLIVYSLCAGLLVAVCGSQVRATDTLSFDTTTIGNAANQHVRLLIAGSTLMQSTDIYAQITVATGILPSLTVTAHAAGTLIGDAGGSGASGNDGLQVAFDGSNILSGSVLDNGTLAIFTFDAHLLQPGDTFTMKLSGVEGSFDTDVMDTSTPIPQPIPLGGAFGTPQQFLVTPEPVSLALLLPVGLALVWCRRR